MRRELEGREVNLTVLGSSLMIRASSEYAGEMRTGSVARFM
jgi:hypothetical protein